MNPARNWTKLRKQSSDDPGCNSMDRCRRNSCASSSAAQPCTLPPPVEPFGLAPLEAAFSRCALITNELPVFHELWGDAACYFRHNDPQDLEYVLGELSNSPE